MKVSSQLVEIYAMQHSTPEDEVLMQLNRETNLKTIYPRMLSGHLQGKLLEMISRMICPSRILEIGTFTGYSAICMAKGLTRDGILHTIDINDELADMAREYVDRAGFSGKIVLHTGDARTIIPDLEEEFDLVFIDGDKGQYPEYYAVVMNKLKSGGFLLADNVLWNGRVLEDNAGNNKETRGIHGFNKIVAADPRVEKLLLPFRDGLFIIHKTGG
ncbi:MAG TPA: O-methyltransferase [Bacteroidales bacterium]|nr:O-methyltransferase [Bacteroidales bacterium]